MGAQCLAGHDNKGEHPAWQLDLVEVRHLPSGIVYYFPCHRWFDSMRDDKLIVRTLEVSLLLIKPLMQRLRLCWADGMKAPLHVP